MIGWGDADNGEDKFVGPSSDAGNFLVAADWARNTATLVGAGADCASTTGRRCRPRAGKHYVSFVVTDGDNLQWMTTSMPSSTDWWANPHRGEVALGWGMPPSMLDLAPSALRWYYDGAHAGPHGDQFTVGPSGFGYFYPSRYLRTRPLEHTSDSTGDAAHRRGRGPDPRLRRARDTWTVGCVHPSPQYQRPDLPRVQPVRP